MSAGFGLAVDFLCGRYTASAHNDRATAEWPPHPARLHMALIDAWGSSEDQDPSERAALAWLESLEPPEIVASETVAARAPVVHYVPDNDVDVTGPANYANRYQRIGDVFDQLRNDITPKQRERLEKKIAKEREVESQVTAVGKTSSDVAREMLPDGRGKQGRYYPTVRPADPSVVYWWDGADPSPAVRIAIDEVAARVCRIGHSSSMVSIRVIEEPDDGRRWRPDHRGPVVLRVPATGMIDALERDHETYERTGTRVKRLLPEANYRIGAVDDVVAVASNLAGTVRIRALSSPIPARHLDRLTAAFRGAVLHHGDDPAPELASGHHPEGTPSSRPHAAYVALPFVGHDRGSGEIHGVAVVVPHSRDSAASEEERLARAWIDRALAALVAAGGELQLGPAGVATLDAHPPQLNTLRLARWTEPSHRWITATPIALGRNPGDLRARDTDDSKAARKRLAAFEQAESEVRRACAHVGLPDPLTVVVSRGPLLDGAMPAHRYSPPTIGGRSKVLVHADMVFAEPVAGPVVLGAGRFRGFGLLAPVDRGAR